MSQRIKARLEYLRKELRAERISLGELTELQSLAKHIPEHDVELLEAAGVPENDETPDRSESERKEIIELARKEHQRDGECEIDNDAKLSEGGDNGTYVQAWVWVSFEDTKFDKEGQE